MALLHIHLMGQFRLFQDDQPVSLDQPRQQVLLAYLLLNRHAPQSRPHLAFLLWPDSTDSQAQANLRTLLKRLRQACPAIDPFLSVGARTLQWRTEAPFTLDVARFEGAIAGADQAEQAGDLAQLQAMLEQAVEEYGGELLPGFYEDWILAERERLAQLYLKTLARLVGLLEEQRAYQRAIVYAQRMVRQDPLHEESYQTLMRLQALSGDSAGALRTYHACAQAMVRELGVEPSAVLQQAYHRLLRVEPAPAVPRSPPVARSLVGRQAEWRSLQAAWQATAAGQVRLALIHGEAGIGKTRLAEELLEWASRQGITIATARIYAAEGAPAYGPSADWLRAQGLQAALRQLEDVWLVEVARLLPELLVERPDLPAPAPLREAWQRQRLFEALARALFAADQPLMLLLDDLQWSDSELLAWLHYLLRFPTQTRWLVLGTVRSEEVTAGHPFHSWLATVRRHGQLVELELGPLSRAETTALAAQVTGQGIMPSVAERLYQETEGNPLFVVEMVRAVDKQLWRIEQWARVADLPAIRLPSPSPSPFPAPMQSVIQARLERLSPPARHLAALAAAAGRAFPFDLLAQASADEERTLVPALEELWQQRIVRELEPGTYDFSHNKIREVAYAGLSTVRRRLLHRRLAQALESLYAAKRDEVSGQIAVHYEQAAMPELAVPYYRRAAAVAQRVFAHAEALAYFSRALSLLPEEEREVRYALLLAREQVYALQGNRGGQREDLARLVAVAKTLADGYRQAEVTLRQARLAEATGAYADATAQAQAALHLAQAGGWRQVEGESLHLLGIVARQQGEYVEAQAYFEQALQISREVGDRRGAGATLSNLGVVSEAQAYLEQALQIHREVGDRRSEGTTLRSLGFASWTQGTYAEAQAYLEQALQIFREVGDRQGEGTTLTLLGVVSRDQGEYVEARAYFEQALQISREVGDRYGEGITLMNLGDVFRAQGAYAEARAYYEQALQMRHEIGDRQGERATLNDLGNISDVQEKYAKIQAHYEQALQISWEIGHRRSEGITLMNLGTAFWAQGVYAKAQAYYEQALQIRREIGDREGEGIALTNLGVVSRAQGTYARAQAYLEQALQISREISDRRGEGECLSNLSALFQDLDDYERAREHSQQAIQIAQEKGYRSLQAEALANLGHALAGLGHLAEASETYQQALALRRELGQPHLALEPLVGLARLAQAQENLGQALAYVEEIVGFLAHNSLAGGGDPFRIYLTCYQILQAHRDARAAAILERAHRLLQEQAAQIEEEALRHSFLHHVPSHRQLVNAWEAKQIADTVSQRAAGEPD